MRSIEVPDREVLVDLYYGENLDYFGIAEHFSVSKTTVQRWMNLHKIPPRINPQYIPRIIIKGDKVYHECTGPLHVDGDRYLPIERFHKRKGNKPRPRCIACESFRKGIEGYVPITKFIPWLESIVRRLGQEETARRLGLSVAAVRSIRRKVDKETGKPKRFLHRKTARKIVMLLAELKETEEVRHKDSIHHGASARGREERTVTAKKDLYVPTGDNDVETRRKNRAQNRERERLYTRNRRRNRAKVTQ